MVRVQAAEGRHITRHVQHLDRECDHGRLAPLTPMILGSFGTATGSTGGRSTVSLCEYYRCREGVKRGERREFEDESGLFFYRAHDVDGWPLPHVLARAYVHTLFRPENIMHNGCTLNESLRTRQHRAVWIGTVDTTSSHIACTRPVDQARAFRLRCPGAAVSIECSGKGRPMGASTTNLSATRG
jgi:hypothetical protein